METIDLSVIVLCHNNGKTIEECDTELSAILPTLGQNIELVYVDNGSSDDTRYRLQKRMEEPTPPNMTKRVVVLRRYFGVSSAFMAGNEYSTGRIVVTLDARLTFDPLEIPNLIEEIEKGYDLVTGWRQRQHLSRYARTRSTLVNALTSRITGVQLKDYGSSFRAFHRDILPDVRSYGELYQFTPVFAHAAGARISEIPVSYRPRYYTGWEYTPRSLWLSILDLITVWFISRHILRPMHVFGSLGFLFILGSFTVLAASFWNKTVNNVSLIETPLPVLAAVLFAVGIQTILMGLTTEIVIRSYYEAQGKPYYTVRQVLESPKTRV